MDFVEALENELDFHYFCQVEAVLQRLLRVQNPLRIVPTHRLAVLIAQSLRSRFSAHPGQSVFCIAHHLCVFLRFGQRPTNSVDQRLADFVESDSAVAQFVLSVFDELFVPGVQQTMQLYS